MTYTYQQLLVLCSAQQ